MNVTGRIGTNPVASTGGTPMLAALEPGTHRLELHATMTGEAWRFVPTWNGSDAFDAVALTTREPRGIDRAAVVFRDVEIVLATLLVGGWIASLLVEYRHSPALLVWCSLSACGAH